MKPNFYFLILLTFVIGLTSCKKEEAPDDNTPVDPNELYISFDLDGVTKDYRTLTANINTGTAGIYSYSNSGIFSMNSNEWPDIGFTSTEDSIKQSDFTALIGQKVSLLPCASGSNCIFAEMNLDLGNDRYRTDEDDNPFPTNYIQVNDVYYHSIHPLSGEIQFIVEGEFNLVLSDGTSTMSATNGVFKLLFWEFTD